MMVMSKYAIGEVKRRWVDVKVHRPTENITSLIIEMLNKRSLKLTAYKWCVCDVCILECLRIRSTIIINQIHTKGG